MNPNTSDTDGRVKINSSESISLNKRNVGIYSRRNKSDSLLSRLTFYENFFDHVNQHDCIPFVIGIHSHKIKLLINL